MTKMGHPLLKKNIAENAFGDVKNRDVQKNVNEVICKTCASTSLKYDNGWTVYRRVS